MQCRVGPAPLCPSTRPPVGPWQPSLACSWPGQQQLCICISQHGTACTGSLRAAHTVLAPPPQSTRQPKDPKAFKDMDALREHLERGESGPGKMGFISGAINWVSNSSFGAQGSRQAWWTPAGLYRLLTRGQHPSCRPGMEVDLTPEDPSDPTYHLITRQHQVLGPLLLLSRSDLRRMAQRYPPVLSMSGDEVALRVLHMREALPGCNTCLLFEQYPQLFLSGDAEQKRQQVKAAVGKLQEALKGAALGSVIMCDPHILFMDLDHGLRELRDLWDVDEAAMAASEPAHLAQAVRTLCNSNRKAGLAPRSS